MTRKMLVMLMIVFSGLSLTGCFNFGGDTAATVDARSRVYESDEFTITIPREWEVIEKNQFTSNIPKETEVVFRNNVKNETFTATTQVLKKPLQEEVSTLDYARMVINRQQDLYDFRELAREEVKMKIDGREENSYLIRFEGRKAPKEKLVRYSQVYAVKGKNAYIVLAAYAPQENESVVKTMEDIVKSLSVK